jgi:hypothetical protein
LVWDGNGTNKNAALTIFRHFDSATVEKGLLGPPPKTAWVIDYQLLERIHYLLVVGYDVYGNLSHQLDTRLYMDFLRMEGEANFLLLLPEAARITERDFWYRNAKDELKVYVSSPVFEKQTEPAINYQTDDPKQELYSMLRARLADVLPTEHTIAAVQEAGLREQLLRLSQIAGTPANLLPEATILRIGTRSGDEYFTLLRNSAYANMSAVFGEDKNRLPAEDTVAVIPGFIGAYPNAFYSIDAGDVAAFVDAAGELATEGDYARLLSAYGVRRTDPAFWQNSDRAHAAFRRESPVTYGVLDYNRLENR